MALGFRKSFFGYNCEDVAIFCDKANSRQNELQNALNQKIEESEKALADAAKENEELKLEISETNQQLYFYKEKYEEVKNLSDNIGKLYLVAQTNAKAIMAAANDAKNSAMLQAKNNVAAIDSAEDSLNILKEKITSLSQDFSANAEQLATALNQVKALIENAEETCAESTTSFEEIFESITK